MEIIYRNRTVEKHFNPKFEKAGVILQRYERNFWPLITF